MHRAGLRAGAAVVLMALLIGCAGTQEEEPIDPRAMALADAYQMQVERERARGADSDDGSATSPEEGDGDQAAADPLFFAQRAERARNGEIVPPHSLIATDLDTSKLFTIAEARADLVGLSQRGATEAMPVLYARAQVAFDCWAVKVERARPEGQRQVCRERFRRLVEEIEGGLESDSPTS